VLQAIQAVSLSLSVKADAEVAAGFGMVPRSVTLPGQTSAALIDRDGLTGRLPLHPAVGVVADQLLLLGVHADDGLAGGQVLASLLVQVAELRVPVGMLPAGEHGPSRRLPLSRGQSLPPAGASHRRELA
jgi:hypothetical protein